MRFRLYDRDRSSSEERLQVRIEPAARRVLKDRLEVALHLRGGRTGLQPSHHLQPPVGRLPQPRWSGPCPVLSCGSRDSGTRNVRRVGDRLLDAGELPGDDADDGDEDVVDLDGLADDGGIGAEPRVPVLGADHRNRRGGRAVVLGQDGAADARGHAEQLIVVARRDERVPRSPTAHRQRRSRDRMARRRTRSVIVRLSATNC